MEQSPNHYVSTRLRALTWSCLDCDLVRSATFFAERYYRHDPSDHQACHLFATALLRGGQTHSAMNLVKDMSCLGCTELFSRCCDVLGQFRKGQAALEQCLRSPSAFATLTTSSPEPRQFPDAAVLLCRAGTLAMKGNLPEQAEEKFQHALALNPLMWEAFEGLCQLGVFPHLDTIIPAQVIRGRSSPQPIPQPSFQPLAYPPLDSSVNRRPWPPGPSKDAHEALFTPVSQPIASNVLPGHAPHRLDHLLGRPPPKFKLNRPYANGRDSISTVDSSLYGGQDISSPGMYSRPYSSEMMLTAGAGPSSFRADDGQPAPKRVRAQMVTSDGRSGHMFESPKEPNRASGSRAVDGMKKPPSSRPPQDSPRRSTRTNGNKPPPGKQRERKRPIRLPSHSDIEGDDDMNPHQEPHSPSALPPIRWSPQPGFEHPKWEPEDLDRAAEAIDQQAKREADAYITDLVRIFARAVQCLAQFQCQETVDALEMLPHEQQMSPWVMTLLARAYYEKLEYAKAERCFQQARNLDPCRLWDMEIYSTLLWHLQRDIVLSYLSQELIAMDNKSPVSWIAVGNCFSLQKEHGQALTCFRRATQLDPRCVYAYNLSGHECISTDDYDKATDFFRQALKVDRRHYPSWYGLGMVYYRTNKLPMAEYHFRKAIQINPVNAVLICCEGMVLESKGDRHGALAIYDRAYQVAPDSPLVKFRRARMLVALQQHQLALDVLLELRESIPEEANIPFMLGQVYRALGQWTEQARFMAIAVDIDPKLSSAIRALQNANEDPGNNSMDTDAGSVL